MQEKKSSSLDFETGFSAIKAALGARWQKDVADRLGITDSAISDAKARGVTPWSWIAKTEKLTQKKLEIQARIKAVESSRSPVVAAHSIPRVGRIPAGDPRQITDADILGWELVGPDVPQNALALQVSGNSMLRPDGTGIQDGDLVYFVEKSDPAHNDVVVVNDEFGDPVLKRLKILPGDEYMLTSDNPKYDPIRPNGGYRVVGVVIRAVRDVPLT